MNAPRPTDPADPLTRSKGKLRVIVVTQPDNFVIPRNIHLLAACEHVRVVGIIEVQGGASVRGHARDLLLGFGLLQSAKMAWYVARTKALTLLDLLIGRWFALPPTRTRLLARRAGIPYLSTRDVNAPVTLSWIAAS